MRNLLLFLFFIPGLLLAQERPILMGDTNRAESVKVTQIGYNTNDLKTTFPGGLIVTNGTMAVTNSAKIVISPSGGLEILNGAGANKVLTSSSAGVASWAAPVLSFTNMIVFDSGAPAEWTNSTATTKIMVEVWGGGGNGGAGGASGGDVSGGGGGGGGYSRSYLTVGATNHFFTVGGAGTASTFLGLTANGGTAGSAGSGSTLPAAGGAGGTATGGQENIKGHSGSASEANAGATSFVSGQGGSAAKGGGGGASLIGSAGGGGSAGGAPGGGGSGGTQQSNAGGAGASGRVIIHY